ncbi:MAG: hypothetical protein IJ600_10680 [Lachnospiraceae bacterium]|nr:hypothetical protein [Lachnospiraceae bacterium]
MFDINSGQVYTLTKISRKITSFTDTEIVFDNEVIFNVITGESEKLSKRFPGIRGKNVVFVSLERDIVYYLDKNEPLSEHSMIIGINSSGEKVDLWKWPELPDHFGKGGYDSLCFDGRRISVKMSKNDTTIYADICMFERSGKCTARYPLDLGRIEGFGASHYMTENGILFLARNVDRSVYASTWLYDELLGDCLKIGDYC